MERAADAHVNLSEAQLVHLTKRDRPTAQARVLRALGIPFVPHPIDGCLLVARSAAERALGDLDAKLQEVQPVVDIDAMRDRRAKAQKRSAA